MSTSEYVRQDPIGHCNVRIVEILAGLPPGERPEDMGDNLRLCYESLVEAGFVPAEELGLVEPWLPDLETLKAERSRGDQGDPRSTGAAAGSLTPP